MERRDLHRNAILKLQKFVQSDKFEQASVIELNEHLRMGRESYGRFVTNHESILGNVLPDDMEVQEDLFNTTTNIMTELSVRILERVTKLQDESKEKLERDMHDAKKQELVAQTTRITELEELTAKLQASQTKSVQSPEQNMGQQPTSLSNESVNTTPKAQSLTDETENQNQGANNNGAIGESVQENTLPVQQNNGVVQQTPSQERQQEFLQLRANEQLRAQQTALALITDLRLGKIKLWLFDGKYAKWTEWRAMFDSLVHNQTTMDTTEKFFFLKGAIEGEAANVLSGWHVTGGNYDEAYQTLVDVYENKYRIVMAHLDELMELQKARTESYDSLRTLIDTTNRVLRQLDVVGCPVRYWGDWVSHLLIRKLPPRTLQQWETAHEARIMPTYETVLAFLKKRVRGLINTTQSQNHEQSTNSHNGANNQNTGAVPRSNRPSANNGTNNNGANSKDLSCYNCKQPHTMNRCGSFRELSVDNRRNRTRELGLCFNCFMLGHRAGSKECPGGPCKVCPGKRYHNSLLCKNQNSGNAKANTSVQINTMQQGNQLVLQPNQQHIQGGQLAIMPPTGGVRALNPQSVPWNPNAATALVPAPTQVRNF